MSRQTCPPGQHDFKENPVVETGRFLADTLTFGLTRDINPRRCRKCGEEE